MKRIVVAVVVLLSGCDGPQIHFPTPPTPAPATFTHYQLYPVNASVAWRLNVETGDVHLCIVTKDDGQCLGLGVK